MLVVSLTATALLQSPGQADATQVSPSAIVSSTPTTTSAKDLAMTIADLEVSRSARTVDDRAEEQRVQDRQKQKRRQEQRREQRQDRRAAAASESRDQRRDAWVLPVSGAGWSASFGESGSAWSSGYHTGQDFTAPSGTPVHAVGPGVITSARWSDAYGNIITITHPGGDESWYAHMSGFERTSGSVEAGEVIGYVGCTGNCYGNHVHLEYHPVGADAADPVPWLRSHGAY
jgi:murein DD-endopeptidase MepM/ murein hydrolase activator NlpD